MAAINPVNVSHNFYSFVLCQALWHFRLSTKEADMFISFIQTLRQHYHLKQTLIALQRRADDRLLDDIGLTRDDLTRLMDTPPARTVGRRPGKALPA
jgi:uncharacterized protein YjiS (DUF1127 family)